MECQSFIKFLALAVSSKRRCAETAVLIKMGLGMITWNLVTLVCHDRLFQQLVSSCITLHVTCWLWLYTVVCDIEGMGHSIQRVGKKREDWCWSVWHCLQVSW